MPTLLVTGGAGFIGSALVRALIGQDEADVIVLDKLTYAGNRESIAMAESSSRFTLVEGDISDGELVRSIFTKWPIDAVVHLAAESHVDRSIDAPAPFIQTNVVGTFTLLDEATRYWRMLGDARRSRFRFLHVSTDEVFGSLGPTGHFTEESPMRPNSPYAASKAAADHMVRAWNRTYGLPVLTSNCSNNFGPFQFPEKLIPLVTLNGLNGEPMPVYGSGENVRDWMYVDDHVAALRAILANGRPGETYCVAGGNERTNLAVVREVCAILDELAPDPSNRPHARLIEFVIDRPGHDHRYAIDAGKIRRELGWAPRESFETGLRRTVAWYLENATGWCKRVQEGRYQRERLGLGATV